MNINDAIIFNRRKATSAVASRTRDAPRAASTQATSTVAAMPDAGAHLSPYDAVAPGDIDNLARHRAARRRGIVSASTWRRDNRRRHRGRGRSAGIQSDFIDTDMTLARRVHATAGRRRRRRRRAAARRPIAVELARGIRRRRLETKRILTPIFAKATGRTAPNMTNSADPRRRARRPVDR